MTHPKRALGASDLILDLFAGPGGWSQGLRMLGLSDVGIEWDDAACRTRRAAGHATVRADVAAYPTEPLAGKVMGLIASPPCQDFSLAGKGAGVTGDRGQLVWQVLRWAQALRPEWIACEQVPPVEPIWKHMAHVMRGWGYWTWVGTLNAADYGVPQTRRRAFLLASLDGPVQPPAPTHGKDTSDGLWGALLPWVTMAEALGWDASLVQRERSGDRAEEGFDPQAVPSQALTSKARPWVVKTGANSMKHSRTGSKAGDGGVVPYERPITEPAPTLDSKVGSAWKIERYDPELVRSGKWPHHGPATTVCGDPRIFAPGGHHTPGQQSAHAIRVSAAEAAVLQSFPADYPWQGSRSKQFEQIGNAVPPLLAAHVLSAVTGLPMPRSVAA